MALGYSAPYSNSEIQGAGSVTILGCHDFNVTFLGLFQQKKE
jgi:hypothetical protein